MLVLHVGIACIFFWHETLTIFLCKILLGGSPIGLFYTVLDPTQIFAFDGYYMHFWHSASRAVQCTFNPETCSQPLNNANSKS